MCILQLWAVMAGWFCGHVRSAIMGCNGRVVLWVKLPSAFRTDLARFL